MKHITILLLTLFFSSSSFAQSISTLNDKANECFDKRDYQCAEKYIKKMIKKDKKRKDKSRYYTDLGTSQRRQNKMEEAMKSYDKAIDINSSKPVYFTNRATLKHSMGDFDGAMADYNAALKLDKYDKTSRINRGMMKMEKGMMKEARADLNFYLKSNPDDIDVESRLVTITKKEGNLEAAIEGYSLLIEKYPTSAKLYNSRADTYYVSKMFEEALLDAEKAIQLDPHYPTSYATKGEVLIQLGNIKEACKAFEKSIELGLNPNALGKLLDQCK